MPEQEQEFDSTLEQVDGTTETASVEDAQETEDSAEQQHEEQEAEYLTRAEAMQLIADTRNQLRSYADKGRNRVEEAIQQVRAYVAQSEALGRPVTEQEAQRLEDKAMRDALAGNLQTRPDNQQQPTQAAIDPSVMVEIGKHDLRMQGKYNTELTANDPEVSMIDLSKGYDPDGIEAAYKAKAQRLAQSKGKTTEGKAAVRAGLSSKGSNPTSEKGLLAELERLQGLPTSQENMVRRRDIMEKLEALGTKE